VNLWGGWVFVDLRLIRIFYVVIERPSLHCSPYQTIIEINHCIWNLYYFYHPKKVADKVGSAATVKYLCRPILKLNDLKMII
jgi:hypothetical protein